METENLYYQFTIFEIDHNYMDIVEFDDDTLFMNIYHFWCFVHFLSPYYSWEEDAIKNLRKNIIKKWPSNDFSNVSLFLELVSCRTKEVNPTGYLFKSEDYFELLMSLKSKMDRMVCDRHLNVNSGVSKRKCIR